jgi:PA14 domain
MLAAAVLAMVLILLAITFAPRIYAYFFARKEHYVRVRRPEPEVRDLVIDALGQEPDSAEDLSDGVVIYSGGASSPAVVLQKRVLSMPLSVANVDDSTVRFHSSGGFEVVASGAMAHAEFGLAPLSGADLVAAKARDPLVYVPPRKTGALVEQKYDGYYNDDISFFDGARPATSSGPAQLTVGVKDTYYDGCGGFTDGRPCFATLYNAEFFQAITTCSSFSIGSPSGTQLKFVKYNSNVWPMIGGEKDIVEFTPSLPESEIRAYSTHTFFFNYAAANASTMGEAKLVTSIQKGDEGSKYSYTWKGVIRPQKSGPHEFWTRSDDASHVYIDGVLVVDNRGVHPPQDRTGTIELAAGRQYAFEVYFGENEGGAEMLLQWRAPNQGWQVDLSPLLEIEPAKIEARHTTRLRDQTSRGSGSIEQGVVRFAHFGPESREALASRKDIAGRPSTCFGIQLQEARKTIAAHDMSSFASPTVSEVMKAANLQAVSLYFTAKGQDRSLVSVFVLPRRAGLPPVSLHVDFVGNDLRLTYLLQTDSVDAGPATVAQNASAQSDRDTVTLPGARTGNNDIMVFVEIVRGKVRVATVEPNRERGYVLQAPTFLRDDEPLRTDALDPPAVMVTSRNVDELVVVPFCVGDLRSLMK